jgi:ABC-type nitrate/sulfonate/bicarbonate transport system permease component
VRAQTADGPLAPARAATVPGRPARPSPARPQPGSWNRGRPRRRTVRISWPRLGAQLACIALAIGLWQLLVSSGVIPTSAVSAPSSVAAALGGLAPTGSFWASTWATVSSWAIGLAISLAVAIPAGLALGASDLAYRMSRVSIDFLRTIPPVALIPLALLLYGATEKMALVLIIFGSVWPVLLQSMYGVHQVDPVACDVARSYQFRRRQVVFDVVLPSAAPFIATGIRIAATMSLLLAVGAELIGGAAGLGASIALAEQNGDIPQMYAYIVTSAVLGVLLNLALLKGERRVLRWHAAHRPAAA